jgi:predicted ferric reductase
VAIPAWIITANPLVAVIILTIIEALGFFPTYRKAWRKPHDESILAFSLTILKYVLALGAMQTYTLTTVLFPIALLILSSLLILELIIRKRVIAQ